MLWLITNAENAYDFFGISDYITDREKWLVTVEWDTNKNTITVKKEGLKDLELRLGPPEK